MLSLLLKEPCGTIAGTHVLVGDGVLDVPNSSTLTATGGATLRSLSRAIDRFCQTHRRFGVPNLMKYIVFISAAVFITNMLYSMQARSQSFLTLLIFSPDLILRGEVWRLITWAFIPLNSSPLFTAIMLYFYYFIGTTLEREWGTAKFTVYYIFGVLLNIVYGVIMRYAFLVIPLLVPNFLNLSMFFAFAALFPNYEIRLFFIIPIKMKWMALINAGFFAYSIIAELISGHVGMALLPLVALLNFFIVCGEDVMNNIRPLRARASPGTINFKKAAKKVRREQAEKAYRHKCEVCGKTDTDNPGLEFRYCSRCNGFHCFCIDHINSHVHFR